jgi:hypothetical protein
MSGVEATSLCRSPVHGPFYNNLLKLFCCCQAVHCSALQESSNRLN